MFSSPMMAQTHRQKPEPCKDTSNMTQSEMNDCAVKELHKAELKLEGLLKQLGIGGTAQSKRRGKLTGTHRWRRFIHTKTSQTTGPFTLCAWPPCRGPSQMAESET
jgi:hypothetical protein